METYALVIVVNSMCLKHKEIMAIVSVTERSTNDCWQSDAGWERIGGLDLAPSPPLEGTTVFSDSK